MEPAMDSPFTHCNSWRTRFYSHMTRPYLYFLFFFFFLPFSFSFIGVQLFYNVVLVSTVQRSGVPCAMQQVLISYLFYTDQCIYVNPNLPIHPTPPRLQSFNSVKYTQCTNSESSLKPSLRRYIYIYFLNSGKFHIHKNGKNSI